MKSCKHFFPGLVLVLVAFAVLSVLVSCGNDPSRGGGTDVDTDTDTDTDADTDSDSDSDTDTDTETMTESDTGECSSSWGWLDTATGLCWQNPWGATDINWNDALALCGALTLGGNGDWRLPTISELRTLVVGCSETELDGGCGVTDDCTISADCFSDYCLGCPDNEGPAPGGCYWDSQWGGECAAFWSYTSMDTDYAWTVYFGAGNISVFQKDDPFPAVSCVRTVS